MHQTRWPNGVSCPHCQFQQVESKVSAKSTTGVC
ncbi:transposase [Endozoicomonas sp. SM1973]|uniref:Transposase n=1 Tax=Spartinivicinus marinus TaxID=2994442 RepID=A0A853IP91_9GAMM|nr:transposase [Spartinivicinus marinus]